MNRGNRNQGSAFSKDADACFASGCFDIGALYDHSPAFIATSAGPDHTFTYANTSYEEFVGRSGLIGRTVADALPEIADQGFMQVLDDVFRTGEPYIGVNVEFTFKMSQGPQSEVRYCDFVYQPVFATDGSVTGIFCEGYDVTQRQDAEARLAALQNEMIHSSRVNAMGAMAATLAHEMSQPLAAMANYAAAAERNLEKLGSASRESVREAITAIADIVERTSQIIKSIRDLTARRQITKTEFEVTAAIDECIKLVSVGTHANQEILNLTSAPITVFANRIQIQQVIINLVGNAVEAAFDGSLQKIVVCANVEGELVKLCVKDTGRGVSALLADDIFISNKTTKKSGMGIGLSVSRAIVEAHGGDIWLAKTGSDGSEFCFTLQHSDREVPNTD
jgi:two-component system sensor kinase FixL